MAEEAKQDKAPAAAGGAEGAADKKDAASPPAAADKGQTNEQAPPPPEAPKGEPGQTSERDRPAAPLPSGAHYVWGTGRRKAAVARVRIRPGKGQVRINKRDLDDYFRQDKDRQAVLAPLEVTRTRSSWDVWANVGGGGFTGQAGAVLLGLARALAKAMPELESALRDEGLLTRDARMRERKKPGQPGARKRFQFSKR